MRRPGSRHARTRSPLALPLLIGVMLGLGAYTFRQAEGFSYFSDRPEACAHCHVMRDHLEAWRRSSHRDRATCNDCHTPHDPLGKLLAKAENGWSHSTAFTLQNFHEPLRITARNRRRVEDACRACHRDLVAGNAGGGGHGQSLDCLHCHAGVGHGPRR